MPLGGDSLQDSFSINEAEVNCRKELGLRNSRSAQENRSRLPVVSLRK
ncbi:MAG: hypothetical protein ACI9R3_006300 [Verrucomicrobiales bacterium]|jgi:hypothetical protein